MRRRRVAGPFVGLRQRARFTLLHYLFRARCWIVLELTDLDPGTMHSIGGLCSSSTDNFTLLPRAMSQVHVTVLFGDIHFLSHRMIRRASSAISSSSSTTSYGGWNSPKFPRTRQMAPTVDGAHTITIPVHPTERLRLSGTSKLQIIDTQSQSRDEMRHS